MALVPSIYFRRMADHQVDEKVTELWRVHRSRENQGLIANTKDNMWAQNHRQGEVIQWNMSRHTSLHQLMTGIKEDMTLQAPWTRMHKSYDDYPSMLSTIDDVPLHQTDTFERHKPFIPKPEHVVGTTTNSPMDDDDEKLHFYDIQGESCLSNPPNPNYPLIDHGLEEDEVWAFKLTGYNQREVRNKWVEDPVSQT